MNILKSAFLLLLIGLVANCPNQAFSLPEPDLRIISLAPNITEILFCLGLEKNIVGITTCCNYPAQTEKIEKVATFNAEANLERILTLKPDLVFSTGLEQAPLIEELTSLGIEVVLIYPQTLDQLFADIIKIGRITQKEAQALRLVEKMRQRVNALREKVKAIEDSRRPKVFVEIWSDPLMTAGHGSFVEELIEIAGGKNIASDTSRPYSQFSPEVVVERNPDYIILGYMQPGARKQISRRLGWQQINAVRQQQVIADINPDLFLRPGPRVVQGLEQIHRRLYP